MLKPPFQIAFLGCGYVSEFYAKTLSNYPQLQLRGVYDANPDHMKRFLERWPTREYPSFEKLLDDEGLSLVVNLTNPRVHFETTRRCLDAGKHVYSEKPLAMTTGEAKQLVDLAAQRKIRLAAAPCSLLSETAQTLAKAVRSGVIGKPRLVYASFDDGMIAPHTQPWLWRNDLGIHWPAKDEFEVGCTFEHAGYLLTWLAAIFGPVRRVTSFASTQILDKGLPVTSMAPDFTVGCLEYDDGVVARVTCGLVAPKDKSMTIVGDLGLLHVQDVRQDAGTVRLRLYNSPSFMQRVVKRLSRVLPLPISGEEWVFQKSIPLLRQPTGKFVSKSKAVDFCRGLADMVAAMSENRPQRLSAELALHITELVEALQHPERFSLPMKPNSTFAPIEPADWAV